MSIEFTRQKNIKKSMAEQNMSYKDAEKHFPKKTYATILSQTNNSDIDLSELDNIIHNDVQQKKHKSNFSNNYTQQRIPPKRVRTQSPNPTVEEHNQILSQFTFPHSSGSLLNDPIYQANLSQSSQNIYNNSPPNKNNTNSNSVNIMVDLVISILDILKEKKLFDINKIELTNLINLKLQGKKKYLFIN